MSDIGIDAALLRWSFIVRTWHEASVGHQPELGPFLAGWFLRQISDAEQAPEVDGFRDSFRAGWEESEMLLDSWRREPGEAGQ